MLAVVLGIQDAIGLSSNGGLSFNIWPSFADKPETGWFYKKAGQTITGLSPNQWSTDNRWRWGGLIGHNGQSIFSCNSGPGTSSGGFCGGPEGCVLFGNIEEHVPANGKTEGVFFIVPGFGEDLAQRQAVWAEFDGLP